jgi:fructose-bisphosphate aldolase class II
MKKINVGTELNKSYIEVVSKTFTADDVTPLTSLRGLLGPANDRIKEIITDKATLFKL